MVEYLQDLVTLRVVAKCLNHQKGKNVVLSRRLVLEMLRMLRHKMEPVLAETIPFAVAEGEHPAGETVPYLPMQQSQNKIPKNQLAIDDRAWTAFVQEFDTARDQFLAEEQDSSEKSSS